MNTPGNAEARLLLSRVTDNSEVWEIVGTYRIHRVRPDDTNQTVNVEVIYREGSGYMVTWQDEQRSDVFGASNPSPNLEVAITMAHWENLDR